MFCMQLGTREKRTTSFKNKFLSGRGNNSDVSDVIYAVNMTLDCMWAIPVHDESMGDEHLLQIVLIMFRDTEMIQLVASLIVTDLER